MRIRILFWRDAFCDCKKCKPILNINNDVSHTSYAINACKTNKNHVFNHARKRYATFSKYVKLSIEHIDLLQSLSFFILILMSTYATFIYINFSYMM